MKCSICGSETDELIKNYSPFNLEVLYYCNDCYTNRRVKYISILNYMIKNKYKYPDDLNVHFLRYIKYNLDYYGISEEQFKKDIEKGENENDPRNTTA